MTIPFEKKKGQPPLWLRETTPEEQAEFTRLINALEQHHRVLNQPTVQEDSDIDELSND